SRSAGPGVRRRTSPGLGGATAATAPGGTTASRTHAAGRGCLNSVFAAARSFPWQQDHRTPSGRTRTMARRLWAASLTAALILALSASGSRAQPPEALPPPVPVPAAPLGFVPPPP